MSYYRFGAVAHLSGFIMDMLTPTDQPCKTQGIKLGYTVWFILIPPPPHPQGHFENFVNQRGGDLEPNSDLPHKIDSFSIKLRNYEKNIYKKANKRKTIPNTASNNGQNITRSHF